MKAKDKSESSIHLQTTDNFSSFVKEIKNDNALLVVGKNFEVSDAFIKNVAPNVDTYILDKLNSKFNTQAVDFSDLAHTSAFLVDSERRYGMRDIHNEIIKELNNCEFEEDDINPLLIKLIKTGKFKFVFTASFSPLVEMAMKIQWGENNVRVKNIFGNVIERDITVDVELQVPTVYYLFGKAENNRFVATDNDALVAVKRWQKDMANSRLLKQTSEKYILAIGCDYDDWLFRFIWYSLKGDVQHLSKGYISDFAKSEALLRYFEQINLLKEADSNVLVERVLKEMENDEDYFYSPKNFCDVFISYSRRDIDIADALYGALQKRGVSVWYDKYNLSVKGGKFMAHIQEAVESCRLFMPIITQNISNEKYDIDHPYRREWEWAQQRSVGYDFVHPIVTDDYSIKQRKYEDKILWLSEENAFEINRNNIDLTLKVKTIEELVCEIKKHQ